MPLALLELPLPRLMLHGCDANCLNNFLPVVSRFSSSLNPSLSLISPKRSCAVYDIVENIQKRITMKDDQVLMLNTTKIISTRRQHNNKAADFLARVRLSVRFVVIALSLLFFSTLCDLSPLYFPTK